MRMNNKKQHKSDDRIISLINLICLSSREVKDIDAFIIKNTEAIEKIASYLGVTSEQALLFSIIFGKNFLNSGVSLKDICNHLGKEPIAFADYLNDIYILRNKRLIFKMESYGRNKSLLNNMCLEVPSVVINKIINDEPLISKNTSDLTLDDFLRQIDEILEQLDINAITNEEFVDDVKQLIEQNSGQDYVARMNAIGLSLKEKIILCILGYKTIDENCNCDLHDLLKRVTKNYNEQVELKKSIIFGKSKLTIEKLIGFEEGFFKGDRVITLTEKGLEVIFGENHKVFLKENTATKNKELIDYVTIAPKQLFYNPKEHNQVEELLKLLQEENFGRIQQTLKDKNMPQGFNILFYGGPGTGKTETVNQLARQCKRDIKLISISETKEKWFGESEKLIKKIFTDYNQCLVDSDSVPILLFNEADGIFGKRFKNPERSVEQTSNAMQNIILQEMETFRGIMIATSNLVENIDSAFERRFLYKIKFEKPCLDARVAIWMEKIPSLQKNEAQKLAGAYDFSGGQIENISRKYVLTEILSGCPPCLSNLMKMCSVENIENIDRRLIGYNSQSLLNE